MSISYICYLPSGLKQSITTKKWQPSGAPTMYKLIEALDTKGSNNFYMISTDSSIEAGQHKISGLNTPINIIKTPNWPAPKRLQHYLNTLYLLFKLHKICRNAKPNLIYLDRSNIFLAAIFAHISTTPIFLRIMGITTDMQHVISGKSIFCRLMRIAYKAPFKFVLCTQDGSGGRLWLNKMLNHKTPRQVLLNGVDLPKSSKEDSHLKKIFPKNKVTILMLGRLEKFKGPDLLLKAVNNLSSSYKEKIHIIIAGEGSQLQNLKQYSKKHQLNKIISFTGNIPHNKVHTLYDLADIYVSLNTQGNLSNANLEAFSSNLCSIIPEPNPTLEIDTYTQELFPDNTTIRIPHQNQIKKLTETFEHLVDNPKTITKRAKALTAAANKHITNWNERIDLEINLLVSLTKDSDKRKYLKTISA